MITIRALGVQLVICTPHIYTYTVICAPHIYAYKHKSHALYICIYLRTHIGTQ